MIEKTGVKAIRLNEVIAFTPAAATLAVIEKRIDSPPNGNWHSLSTGERLYRIPSEGWVSILTLPSRRRSKALWTHDETRALRVLTDATATVTRTRLEATEDDLIASPSESMSDVATFIKGAMRELDGEGSVRGAGLMDEDTTLCLPLEYQTPYPVTELELENDDVLRRLVEDGGAKAPASLHQLLAYLVTRNYRVGSETPTFAQMCEEVLLDVLDDGFLLHSETPGPAWRLRNLSQGKRAFISFGRRGTVIAYATKDSRAIRGSVLTMIETLRSRFHNLLVASTLMDALLVRLARLMEDGQSKPADKEIADVTDLLRRLGTATYIYGLAVTDPGAQLLDGSVVSVVADRAESYFEIQSLRHACHRKMEALRTIWASYQDRRRQTLLQALRSPAAPLEARA
ncbi:MAG TPA: hypothetical protein VGJ81_05475 [Thermoanaerobaculia bacterium]|jgi:hypothetical protein